MSSDLWRTSRSSFTTNLLFGFPRNLLSFLARFRKADGYRLLAALHFLAALAHLQPALLELVHLTLDILARAFGIFSCHGSCSLKSKTPVRRPGSWARAVRGRTRGICSSPKVERGWAQ